MIVVIGGQKGGTGKTTIATNLAVIATAQGVKTALVDCDRQESASTWAEIRGEDNIDPHVLVVQKTGRRIAKDLMAINNDHDLVIVDAGGHDSQELRQAFGISDCTYIVLQASSLDMWTMDAVQRIKSDIEMTMNREKDTRIIVNRASTHSKATDNQEATEFLENYPEFSICNTIVHERIAFRKAAGAGLSVIETQRDSKAASEMMALYQEIVPESVITNNYII